MMPKASIDGRSLESRLSQDRKLVAHKWIPSTLRCGWRGCSDVLRPLNLLQDVSKAT